MENCPLCGSHIPDGENTCSGCGAKEYRVPVLGIRIGYLYLPEYLQWMKLVTTIIVIGFAIGIIWMTASYYIQQLTP